MKTRITLGIIGWSLVIILGVIHFYYRDELMILYSGYKGLLFQALS
ncbi:hypothetical protein [Virgibacillus doumboii]|nr:hypothetical protein [Virgibacillus doumboii]